MRNELKKALSHESKRVIVDSSKLESWLDKLDNTNVQFVCYLCGTEQQVSIATLVSHTHVKCIKCGKILFLLKSRSNGHVEGPRAVDEHSADMCAACDIDLGTCDTIWAAGGALYCSRECGEYDYSMRSDVSAEEAKQLFDEEAEEIDPRDIGLPYMTLHELSERNFTRAVIVFKDESYDKPYPFTSRAYEVSGDSNYFKPHKISKALYGTSLDMTDVGVRLDWYLGDWVVDYCFIIE